MEIFADFVVDVVSVAKCFNECKFRAKTKELTCDCSFLSLATTEFCFVYFTQASESEWVEDSENEDEDEDEDDTEDEKDESGDDSDEIDDEDDEEVWHLLPDSCCCL